MVMPHCVGAACLRYVRWSDAASGRAGSGLVLLCSNQSSPRCGAPNWVNPQKALAALDRDGHCGVGREELRRLFDPHLFGDRAERGSEALNRFFGFEDVENAEAVWPLSGGVYEETVEREVGGRLDAALSRETADDLLVSLLRQARR